MFYCSWCGEANPPLIPPKKGAHSAPSFFVRGMSDGGLQEPVEAGTACLRSLTPGPSPGGRGGSPAGGMTIRNPLRTITSQGTKSPTSERYPLRQASPLPPGEGPGVRLRSDEDSETWNRLDPGPHPPSSAFLKSWPGSGLGPIQVERMASPTGLPGSVPFALPLISTWVPSPGT